MAPRKDAEHEAIIEIIEIDNGIVTNVSKRTCPRPAVCEQRQERWMMLLMLTLDSRPSTLGSFPSDAQRPIPSRRKSHDFSLATALAPLVR